MTDPAAPPAWLLASIFAGAICLFIGFLYFVQLVKRLASGGLPHMPRAPAMRLRRRNGQFRGSERASELRSKSGTASESAVPPVTSVSSLPLSVPDVARISYDLGRGIAPSDIAKSLPGYSARNYKDYAERVRQVQGMIGQEAPKEAVAQSA